MLPSQWVLANSPPSRRVFQDLPPRICDGNQSWNSSLSCFMVVHAYLNAAAQSGGVAFLLAGPPEHNHVKGVDYPAHLFTALIEPVWRGGTHIGLFVTSNNYRAYDGLGVNILDSHSDVNIWWHATVSKLCEKIKWSVNAVVAMAPRLPDRANTRFGGHRCTHRYCEPYFRQWGHSWRSLQLMLAFELWTGAHYKYIVKARNDFTYRPVDKIDGALFKALPNDTVAVPSIEFQRSTRWLENGTKSAKWPWAINDQLFLGGRSAMLILFGVFLSNRISPGGGGLSVHGAAVHAGGEIEAILAHHIKMEKLRVVTVELQPSSPGHPYSSMHKGKHWVDAYCHSCFVATRAFEDKTTGGLGGVGPKLDYVEAIGEPEVSRSFQQQFVASFATGSSKSKRVVSLFNRTTKSTQAKTRQVHALPRQKKQPWRQKKQPWILKKP